MDSQVEQGTGGGEGGSKVEEGGGREVKEEEREKLLHSASELGERLIDFGQQLGMKLKEKGNGRGR